MAAHSNNFIRVRLHFDYAPPAVIGCRMCWLLVDLNTCRVVADLECIIREKFEFSRRSILSLFIEDCYLPHTESIYVVRDNDCVRVKVDSLAQVTGHSASPGEHGRKRRRPEAEDGNEDEERTSELENGVSLEWKKKKRKKHKEESPKKEREHKASGEEMKKKSQKKHKDEKKKKKKEPQKTISPAPLKPAPSAKKAPTSVEQPVKTTKKPPVMQASTRNVSSSDSSSTSEEDEPPKKTPAPNPLTKTPAASKTLPNNKPPPKKLAPPSSSSSGSDSSSDETTTVKKTQTNTPLISIPANRKISENSQSLQATDATQSTTCAQNPAAPPHDSNNEEEIELVIRHPMQQLGRGGGAGRQPSWRGHGRGRGGREWGRGGGFRGAFRGLGYDGDNVPSYSSDSLTNVSVVLQNGEQSTPKQDYSSMPLLAAPPQVGQKIAFKLLELTENYTPEVSEYKEAKIMSFDLTTKQIELELLNTSQAPVEPGKFDLVYQNPDGSERVEYAVARSSLVTERWDSLLEPRLII